MLRGRILHTAAWPRSWGSPQGLESSSWPADALHGGQAGLQHRGLRSPGGINPSGRSCGGLQSSEDIPQRIKEGRRS